MKHLRVMAGASLLALAAAAAIPAAAQSTAQSTGGTTSQGSGAQGSSPTTGALPNDSLAGQRQGTVGGAVTQGGGQSGSSGSSGTTTYGTSGSGTSGTESSGVSGSSGGTGALPDNSLAGQRQGAIGGGAVTQGGNQSSGPPKQGSGQ